MGFNFLLFLACSFAFAFMLALVGHLTSNRGMCYFFPQEFMGCFLAV
jgi:hypothetical protein